MSHYSLYDETFPFILFFSLLNLIWGVGYKTRERAAGMGNEWDRDECCERQRLNKKKGLKKTIVEYH